MQVARQLLSYKSSPNALRHGVTKGWNETYSWPERIYSSQLKNYLKFYHIIKEWLKTQDVRLLSFSMVPQDTTTVISMNIFWYKPLYRQEQTRRSKVFRPWTGWQSRWSRPPPTLWRPRIVQNLTHERRVISEQTVDEIASYNQEVQEEQSRLQEIKREQLRIKREQRKEQQAAAAAAAAAAGQEPQPETAKTVLTKSKAKSSKRR